ncbi:Threonylcarbamoyl-AMP synthase [Candidatus Rhabdochlamydia oedothoracis]|uniref:Threonylcarbamoyl-AMP synthase n=1 Tax=Candidatus Rhabdochlamydia oedothoracis TaxID=2720720 RepID=A0ABX8V2N8_9BACT|nr:MULTISPECIES: L-threonylcarbamoyladenylate synthase [Rhabdochlamydia]KAG6559731.1 Threonylcarbamoyl-AMP synthase [Candidatus Rhabdochlamydia sp. W815]MCL6756009.1 L-threonylcarbamoyladenylate synthase [Candidatus Rhabdochlamydia oedothoracis]QYF48757.1 Threonylcarbamoyl-AMP synthase [Candidatus Rhabdochlamydia oedothoracis]
MKTKILTSNQLHKAAMLLYHGQLVAIPTETVYGLAALISSESALSSIFAVKKRPMDNPLIVHIASLKQIDQIALPPSKLFLQLAEAFFPGPLTMIIPRHRDLSPLISAGLDSVAIRMPSHPMTIDLIHMLKAPIVAPSANLSGRPSATTVQHVLDDFDRKIPAIVDGGKTTLGVESTVISLLSNPPVILRPGSITKQEIENVLGITIDVQISLQKGPVYSPGLKYRHYAPCIPVKLFYKKEQIDSYCKKAASNKRMLLSTSSLFIANCDYYKLSTQDLYACFRHAEKNGYSEILIFCDSMAQSNVALMNRLTKASD